MSKVSSGASADPGVHAQSRLREGWQEQCLLPTCRNLGVLAVGSALEGGGSSQDHPPL